MVQIGHLDGGNTAVDNREGQQIEASLQPPAVPQDHFQPSLKNDEFARALYLFQNHSGTFSEQLAAFESIAKMSSETLLEQPVQAIEVLQGHMQRVILRHTQMDFANRFLHRTSIRACKEAYQVQMARLQTLHVWGRTPYLALAQVVRRGDVAQARRLWDNVHAPTDARNSRGETMLFEAVRSGSLEMVQLMLEKGVPVHVFNQQGYSALHEAITGKKNVDNIGMVLLKKGAYLFQEQEQCSIAAYDLMRQQGRTKLVNFADKMLHNAERVLELFQNGVWQEGLNIVEQKPVYYHLNPLNRRNLLMESMMLNVPQRSLMLQALINAGGNFDIATPAARALLQVAAQKGDIALWQMLITRGVQLLAKDQKALNRLLEKGISARNLPFVIHIVEYGADPDLLLALSCEDLLSVLKTLQERGVLDQTAVQLLEDQKRLEDYCKNRQWKKLAAMLEERPSRWTARLYNGDTITQVVFRMLPCNEGVLLCALAQLVSTWKRFFLLVEDNYPFKAIRNLIQRRAPIEEVRAACETLRAQSSQAYVALFYMLMLQEKDASLKKTLFSAHCTWPRDLQLAMSQLEQAGRIKKEDVKPYLDRAAWDDLQKDFVVDRQHMQLRMRAIPPAPKGAKVQDLLVLCAHLFKGIPEKTCYQVDDETQLSVVSILARIHEYIVERVHYRDKDVALSESQAEIKAYYANVERMLAHICRALEKEKDKEYARMLMAHLAYVSPYCAMRLFHEVSSLYRSLCGQEQGVACGNEERLSMYAVVDEALLAERRRIFNFLIAPFIGEDTQSSHTYNYLLETLGVQVGVVHLEETMQEVVHSRIIHHAHLNIDALQEEFDALYTPARIGQIVQELILAGQIKPAWLTEAAANFAPKALPDMDADSLQEDYIAYIYDEDYEIKAEGLAYLLTGLGFLKPVRLPVFIAKAKPKQT